MEGLIERRTLLRSLLVAPFVVRTGVLMPIKPILLWSSPCLTSYIYFHANLFKHEIHFNVGDMLSVEFEDGRCKLYTCEKEALTWTK